MVGERGGTSSLTEFQDWRTLVYQPERPLVSTGIISPLRLMSLRERVLDPCFRSGHEIMCLSTYGQEESNHSRGERQKSGVSSRDVLETLVGWNSILNTVSGDVVPHGSPVLKTYTRGGGVLDRTKTMKLVRSTTLGKSEKSTDIKNLW